jgi:hypothetical protein
MIPVCYRLSKLGGTTSPAFVSGPAVETPELGPAIGGFDEPKGLWDTLVSLALSAALNTWWR